jgi:hypothetical protein
MPSKSLPIPTLGKGIRCKKRSEEDSSDGHPLFLPCHFGDVLDVIGNVRERSIAIGFHEVRSEVDLNCQS